MSDTPATESAPKDLWPAVDDAFAFVLPSYQLLGARFEAADTRLTSFLTLAATLTLGAPLFARTVRPDIPFRSWWFAIGMASFVLAIVVGISGRLYGRLVLPDPMRIYTEHLHKNTWAFRKDLLYFAGEHFERNANAIRVKGNLSVAVIALLTVEIVAFVIWIAR